MRGPSAKPEVPMELKLGAIVDNRYVYFRSKFHGDRATSRGSKCQKYVNIEPYGKNGGKSHLPE